MSDANESLRQDVKQESSDELVSRDGHRSHLVAAGVISPTEGNALAIEGDESVVGDGDPMSITTEIADDLLRPAEGWFGIDNPILTKQRSKERSKVFRVCQVVDRSGARQPFLLMSAAESGDELSTKHSSEVVGAAREQLRKDGL